MCLLSQCSWETDIHENLWILMTWEVITRDPQPGLSSGPCTHGVEHIPTPTLFIFKNWMLELCDHLKSWLPASLGVSTEVAEPDSWALVRLKSLIRKTLGVWSTAGHSLPPPLLPLGCSQDRTGPWLVMCAVCVLSASGMPLRSACLALRVGGGLLSKSEVKS